MWEPFFPMFPGLGGCEEQLEEDGVLFHPLIHRIAKKGLYSRIMEGSGFTVGISAICVFGD